MKTTKRLIIGVLALLAGIILGLLQREELARAVPVYQTNPLDIIDRYFYDNDWTVQTVMVGNPFPSSSTQRRATGGNPDYYRSTQDTFPATGVSAPHTITTVHLDLLHSYNPASRGPIDHIDYQVDQILLRATPVHWTTPVYGYLLVVQNGIIYRGGQTIINSPTWQTSTLNGLQATDFHPLDNPTSSSHPDFSAQGPPLTFGYASFVGQTFSAPTQPPPENLVYEHGIDNWRVTVWPANTVGNRAPTAVDDSSVVSYHEGESEVGSVLMPILNDSDPDGDRLVITNVTTPLYGSVNIVPGAFSIINYSRLVGTGYQVDSFNYTISDGEFSDTAEVRVFLDCGCAVECLGSSISGVATTSTLDIGLLHRLRDQVMKPTPNGKRYVDMYYTTTLEIATILMLTRTDLGTEAVDLVKLWQDNLYSLVDGDGSALVTQAQVDAIETFLTHLSAASSTELQQLIATELARLGPLDDYVGLTVKAAKTKAIGDPIVYLPLIIK